jgi:hypothetical protein
MNKTMQLEGVLQLPPPKSQQVATYRCTIDLATAKADVQPGKRSGAEEEAAWNNLSTKLKSADLVYEVVIEENAKSAKGTNEWSLVTLLETQVSTGKLLRKISVQEFWGVHDRHAARGLRMKDGHVHFFVQFWPAE